MSLNASNVRIAGTGEIRVATLGSAAPTSASAVMPSATWVGLGFTDEDGVSISRERDTEDINAWQSATPVRTLVTGQSLEVSTTFIETKAKVLELWWGGAFSANAGEFKADMLAVPTLAEFALCVDWEDGAIKSRLYVPRVTVSETGDLTLNRSEATAFELTFSALAPASGPLATWFSTDAALVTPAV